MRDILLERALAGERLEATVDCRTVLVLLARLGVASMSGETGSSSKGESIGTPDLEGASSSSLAGTGGGGGDCVKGCSIGGLYTVF